MELLSKVKDYNLWHTDEIVEECDSIYDLFYEITIILFNDYLLSIDDLNNYEYIESVNPYYIKDSDGIKIPLTDFIPLIYIKDDEWRIKGDEHFNFYFYGLTK